MSRATSARLPAPTVARPPLRRWAWRLMLLAWLSLTIYLAFAKWGTWPRLQAKVLLAQRRCTGSQDPPDRVVLEMDPERAAVLLKARQYRPVRRMSRFSLGDGPPTAAVSTASAERLDEFLSARECLDTWDLRVHPPTGAQTSQVILGPRMDHSPSDSFVLFHHALRSGNGPERLVVLHADWYGYFGNPLSVYATVIAPGTFTREATSLSFYPGDAGEPLQLTVPGGGRDLRLYAGQANPTDPSRFTVAYETSGGRGTIEGQLLPDDKVELKVHGPAIQTAP